LSIEYTQSWTHFIRRSFISLQLLVYLKTSLTALAVPSDEGGRRTNEPSSG